MKRMRTNKITPLILVKNDEYWLPYVLKAISGWFSRYVIYNVGSEDRTKDIIDGFVRTESLDADLLVRHLPHCDQHTQICFRNSMIVEAENDWYLLVDGDELWPQDSILSLLNEMHVMMREYEESGKIYGIVRRMEVGHDLKTIHGVHERVPHHRVYHRSAYWKGTHPGEEPVIAQKPKREFNFHDDVRLYHFHQPLRSSKDDQALRRLNRRFRNTYVRGEVSDLNLLETVPELNQQIGDFPLNPILETLQRGDEL